MFKIRFSGKVQVLSLLFYFFLLASCTVQNSAPHNPPKRACNNLACLPSEIKTQLVEAHKYIVLEDDLKADEAYKNVTRSYDISSVTLPVYEEYLAFLVKKEDISSAYEIAQKILNVSPQHFLANAVRTAYLIEQNNIQLANKLLWPIAVNNSQSLNSSLYALLITSQIPATSNEISEYNTINQQLKNVKPDFYYTQRVYQSLLAKKYPLALKQAKLAVNYYPSVGNVLTYCKLLVTEKNNTALAVKVFRQYLAAYLAERFLTDKSILHMINAQQLDNTCPQSVVANGLMYFSSYLSNKKQKVYLEPDSVLVTHLAHYLNSNNELAKLTLAQFYLNNGNYNKALDLLKLINPGDFYGRLTSYVLAGVYNNLGQSQNALQVYEQSAAIDPNTPEPELQIAHVYYKNSNYTKALEHYSKALKISIQHHQPLGMWLAYYFRGLAYNAQGNVKAAYTDLKRAYHINSKDPLLQNYLGYILFINNINIKLGKKLILSALKQQPNNPAFLDSYAWVNYKAHNYSKALKLEKEALQSSNGSTDSVILEHVGDIYSSMLKKDKAVLYWKKAMNFSKHAKVQQRLHSKIKAVSPQPVVSLKS